MLRSSPTLDAITLTPQTIVDRILVLRGVRVLLDSDLAALYDVPTKVLNQAVARNASRFPPDFAFRINSAEYRGLRSHRVTSSMHGGARYLPRVFTEQGVAMLSGVLRSPRAIEVNITIMRTFVQLRAFATLHEDLASRIDDLERRYDGQFADVFDAIRELALPTDPEEQRPRIGFTPAG